MSNTIPVESLKFFIDNSKQINDARDLHNSINKYLQEEIFEVLPQLNVNLNHYYSRSENERLRYFLSTNNPDLFFTIVFEDLLNEKKKLYIIIELEHKALENRNQYKEVDFDDVEKRFLKEEFYSQNHQHRRHFAVEVFENMDFDKVYNIQSFIVDKINNGPLINIFRKLDTFLTNHRQNG